jgi:hypothetical protein
MASKLSNSAASACMGDGVNKGLLDLLAGARMHFYDGTQPDNPDVLVTVQENLSEGSPFVFGSPAGVVVAGVLTLGTPYSAGTVSVESGTPTWFRIFDSEDNPLWDGSVGTTGADCNFNSVTWLENGTIAVSGTLRVPAH